MRRFRSVALLALVVVLVAQSIALAATQVINDNLTLADPTQTSRAIMNGIASTCNAPKAFPGEIPGGYSHYDTHTIVNPHTIPVCVEVTLTAAALVEGHLLVVAYLGAYDPLDITANYLADGGLGVQGTSVTFSFELGPGAMAVLVVASVFDDALNSYTLEIVIHEPNYQACLYAGSLSQVSAIAPETGPAIISCGRGELVVLTGGEDIWACLFAGSLSQVGDSEPANCGRGNVASFAAGTDIWACRYAGALSRVGYAQPPNCGRGSAISIDATDYSAQLTATLLGINEVPPVDTPATGAFSMLVLDGVELCYTLSVENLTEAPIQAHIHNAQAGVNGPVVVHLTVPPGTTGEYSECVAIDPVLVADILANPGDYYVNVHTVLYPGGEIRGQLGM